MFGAVSGVITTGEAGTAFWISLPLGVAITSSPKFNPKGDVSTIVIGPPFISDPCIRPGKPSTWPSRSTKKRAEPPHLSPLLIPAPNIATYLSESKSPSEEDGILTIFGVDQVSPNLL